MSLHFLLDGYNILHQMPQSRSPTLEDQRACLIQLIESKSPQGSLKNKITIVFDGLSGRRLSRPSSVEVVFSNKISADSKIKHIVSQSDNPKNIIVVTDDRQLGHNVRSKKAKWIKVAEFLAKTETDHNKNKKRAVKRKTSEDSKHISKGLEYKITEEFEQIWLKKKNKK